MRARIEIDIGHAGEQRFFIQQGLRFKPPFIYRDVMYAGFAGRKNRSQKRPLAASSRAADKRAERGIASAYDEVKRSLVDLSDAYALCATRANFDRRLGKFMARHGKRDALVRRLVEAGLC